MNPRVFVIPRKYKSGKRVWVVRWKNPATGRWGYESWGGDRTAAKRHAEQIRHQIRMGILEDVIQVKWSEFVRLHLETLTGQNRGSTAATFKRFEALCRPAGPHSVTYTQVERFKLHRLRTVTAVTVNRELREIQAALNAAVKRQHIKANPAIDLKMAAEDKHLPVVVSDADKRLLLQAAPDLEWRAFMYVAMTTGCRVGEVRNLTWDCVDLNAKVIHLTRTKTRQDRLQPLVGAAVGLLAEIMASASKRIAGGELYLASVFVFPRIRLGDYKKRFAKIRQSVGLSFRLKDLRSTAASDVVNTALRQAAKHLGHSRPGMTREHYLNVELEALRRVAEAEALRLKDA